MLETPTLEVTDRERDDLAGWLAYWRETACSLRDEAAAADAEADRYARLLLEGEGE